MLRYSVMWQEASLPLKIGHEHILRMGYQSACFDGGAQRSLNAAAVAGHVSQEAAHVAFQRQPQQAILASMLFRIFMFCGKEKLFQTLQHTTGYVAKRIDNPLIMESAALADAVRN